MSRDAGRGDIKSTRVGVHLGALFSSIHQLWGPCRSPAMSGPQFPQFARQKKLDWVTSPQCFRVSRGSEQHRRGIRFQGHAGGPRTPELGPPGLSRAWPRDSETAQARRPAKPGRLTVSSVLHEPTQRLQVGTRPQIQIGKHRHAEVTWALAPAASGPRLLGHAGNCSSPARPAPPSSSLRFSGSPRS